MRYLNNEEMGWTPQKKRVQKALTRNEYWNAFPARHHGWCANCQAEVRIGDLIHRQGTRWAHLDCPP